MLPRRSHRKSRHGCAECKRRHIKCDEVQPKCGNCTITKRECSFVANRATLPVGLTPQSRLSSTPSSAPSRSPLSDTPKSPFPASEKSCPSSATQSESDFIPPAHLAQLQLLHHFSHSDMGFPGYTGPPDKVIPVAIIQEALSCDFLMNEVLAFSAMHLAILKLEERAVYLHQAKQYQTHALASFTRTQIIPTRDNCLSIVCFSWLLGTHLLCEINTSPDHLDVLGQFMHYVELYRGVTAVTVASWQFLLESEHRGMFQDGQALAKKLGSGSHTASLRSLIHDSVGMDETQKHGTAEALSRIQWVIDMYEEKDLEGALMQCFLMVFCWPLVITPEFVGLLQRRRPEALLVLAHFTVLLHWCGRHWIFGEIGSRLLGSVMSTLGQGWERWLQWPREMVKNGGS
ncbi:hypothetical protein G7046_g3803 [Stylonectria norvegica]|nr:hypothetical protein G7046_g3803 [Stylonectria norvegica]